MRPFNSLLFNKIIMAKLFAIIVDTIPDYYSYKEAHPDHEQEQGIWFRQQQEQGKLLCCGPFLPPDGTGLWILRADSLEEAQAISETSPRVQSGLLADSTRIVEWDIRIGQDVWR